MTSPWVDYVNVMLPGLIFASVSIFPLTLATIAAWFALRNGRVGLYVSSLWGSTAAGGVALLLLFGSLFGADLSSSSTAGLIFLFAPIYSAIALVIGYAIGAAAYRKLKIEAKANGASLTISSISRRLLWVPFAILSVLAIGIMKTSIKGNDLAVAERASNPETLQWELERVSNGTVDPFGVPLFLAQNPNTPTSILDQLSKHDHLSVRTFVARHPNTSVMALESMSNDCDPRIRKEVQERLQLQLGSNISLDQPRECGASTHAQ
jgi:hypothetical protein